MNTLALIVSSKVRAEILRIFFGVENREIHLREIERRTGFAIGTVRQETQKLEKIGLLNKRKDGNRTYFIANREHPLYNEIHGIVLKTSGLADAIRQGLKDEDIRCAFIFGSIAEGSEKPESDIDLFVIGNAGLRRLSASLKKSARNFGRELNIVAMTEKEFSARNKKKDHFVLQVMNSPKIMIKGTENELERMG